MKLLLTAYLHTSTAAESRSWDFWSRSPSRSLELEALLGHNWSLNAAPAAPPAPFAPFWYPHLQESVRNACWQRWITLDFFTPYIWKACWAQTNLNCLHFDIYFWVFFYVSGSLEDVTWLWLWGFTAFDLICLSLLPLSAVDITTTPKAAVFCSLFSLSGLRSHLK